MNIKKWAKAQRLIGKAIDKLINIQESEYYNVFSNNENKQAEINRMRGVVARLSRYANNQLKPL